jgi:hypothetical protein
MGEAGLPVLPDVIGYLESLQVPKEKMVLQPFGKPGSSALQFWCLRLGQLGQAGRPAIPLLERLRTNDLVGIRTAAGLALARISGKLGAVPQFFENEVRPAGLAAMAAFVGAAQQDTDGVRTIGDARLDDLYPIWISLLTQDPAAGDAAVGGATEGPSASHRAASHWDYLRLSAAQAVQRYGRNAVPAVPVLTRLLRDPDGAVREEASETLRRLGPVAPETLPQWVSALDDPWLLQYLVPLVGGYGPLASNAVPTLELVAAGQLPTGWTNHGRLPAASLPTGVGVLYRRLLAERYGISMPGGGVGQGVVTVGKDGGNLPRLEVRPRLRQSAAEALRQIQGDGAKISAEPRTGEDTPQ